MFTTPENEILVPEELLTHLHRGRPVAMGVSGGKDSGALALSLTEYLDSINHPKEKRVLIHSDLGSIEWKESLEWCQKLSEKVSTPLIVVSRKAGGMIERWETRWKNNWERYHKIECLRLILPWSTASMRFCTSELKTDIICRELKKRFPGETIISAIGIRADESPNRAKAPIFKIQPKLQGKTTHGFDWSPIKIWTLENVKAIHTRCDFPLHPAYTQFGSSRVSCSFCILATANDQTSALRQPHNHFAYKLLCDLELRSAFSFQGTRWLCDLDPELRESLLPNSGIQLATAKKAAIERQRLEALLPKDLNFEKGKQWPPRKITDNEAELMANVRNQILALYHDIEETRAQKGITPFTPSENPQFIKSTLNTRVENNSGAVQLELLTT